MGLLLERGLKLLAHLRQLLRVFNLRLLKGLGLAACHMDALLSLLCLGARLRQLLHQIVELLRGLRLLLPLGLQILLSRGQQGLSLIAGRRGLIVPAGRCCDLALQVGQRSRRLLQLSDLVPHELFIGAERQDLSTSAALVLGFVQLCIEEQPPPEQGSDRQADQDGARGVGPWNG